MAAVIEPKISELPEPDETIVKELVSSYMVSRKEAVQAARTTHNCGVEEALGWLMQSEEDKKVSK